MKKEDYQLIEAYMLDCMQNSVPDSAHDKNHIYRVLYTALDIAGHEENVDSDVLIAACLLHDIGRKEQFENPKLCHAAVGAGKAHDFLLQHDFPEDYAAKVAACIKAHRFRTDNPPVSIEEKILFDADKIDVSGALGLARTIFYKGQLGEPLYLLNEDGMVSDGSHDKSPSLFQEYKFKLEGLYTKFYTERGGEIARRRQHSAVAFYEALLQEAREPYLAGRELLAEKLEPVKGEIVIRQEKERDFDQVYSVVKTAFETAEHSDGNEHELVTALRKSPVFVPELSLVAEIDGKIAGHVMFTEIKIGNCTGLALAPLAVLPKYQNQGVGSALVKEGHRIAKKLGYGYSVVLGSEKYYPRFGYVTAESLGIQAPFEVPAENFMALRLREDGETAEGVVKYAPEFGI